MSPVLLLHGYIMTAPLFTLSSLSRIFKGAINTAYAPPPTYTHFNSSKWRHTGEPTPLFHKPASHKPNLTPWSLIYFAQARFTSQSGCNRGSHVGMLGVKAAAEQMQISTVHVCAKNPHMQSIPGTQIAHNAQL